MEGRNAVLGCSLSRDEFVTQERAMAWFERLNSLNTFYVPTLMLYGKPKTQNRSVAAYASSPTVVFKYSGHQTTMHHNIPPVVADIWTEVAERLGLEFNCVLINRYADGNEAIGLHRDGKENGVIASLSLGAVRTFSMVPATAGGKAKQWKLANGGLVVMRGATQENYKHEVPNQLDIPAAPGSGEGRDEAQGKAQKRDEEAEEKRCNRGTVALDMANSLHVRGSMLSYPMNSLDCT
ncbi:Fe2OG dioxygenase domain-containing protein [Mycena kentingensis (nom. inval.)]|nr:Fe2OG dioxygenase domain-containing protein [Mycena kentingensis (nom. inval.)]